VQREYRDARRGNRPAADREEKTMTNREVRAALNQQKSLEAFLAAKAEFDALIAELQQASAEHFGADSEQVFWEHVETLRDWNHRLRDMANAYYRRGEYAA
jgi:ATP-dependent protease HslVU (ClpYQ) peptidase subunit